MAAVSATKTIAGATSEQVAEMLAPIFAVDACRESAKIGQVIANCMQSISDLTFQKVEIELRRKKCFTHLIARRIPDGYKSLLRNKDKPLHLWLSTRDLPFVMEEMLEESESYNDNFLKLKDVGFLFIGDVKKFAEDEKKGRLKRVKPEGA